MLLHYSVSHENTKHLQKEVQGRSFEVQQFPQDLPCPKRMSAQCKKRDEPRIECGIV